MADMEWNDLAGQSLPSMSDNGTGSSWKVQRNLSELQQAANQSAWQQGSAAMSGAGLYANAAGGAATTPNQSPWASLQQQPAATTNACTQPAAATESVQDMLGRHEQGIVAKILQQTEQETRQRTDELIERQIQQAFEKDRDCWIRELVGTRTLGGAAGATTTSGAPLQSTAMNAFGSNGRNQSSALIIPGQSWSDQSHMHGNVGASRPQPSGPLDPQAVQAHLRILQEQVPPSATWAQLQHAVDKLQKLADPALGSPVESGYTAAWQLVGKLIKVHHSQSPVDHAMAALVHFCQQFQMRTVNRVRQAALAGQDISVPVKYANGTAEQCAAFCKLTLGVSDSPWPVLFYCLRCGDAVAAKEVLGKSSMGLSGDTESAVRRIIDGLAQGQRDASCFWEAGSPRLDASDCRVVADHLERSKHIESTEIHQLGVLALLCGTGQQPSSDNVQGFNTIEDYLTSSLWKALCHSNPVDELVRLGEVMNGYGPDYFGDNWAFALPLLATQQYQRALLHLAEVGGATGLLQATHMGLILTMGDVQLRNLGQAESSDTTVASLLVAYANKLLTEPTAGSLAAFEYVSRIPDKTQARREVASLIAKTGAEKLVGQLDANGVRQNGGVLEKRFSPADISTLLGDAADILLRENSDCQRTGSAAMCFMLAGRFADVLSLLNQLLSPPDKPDENRKFWLDQTKSFHEHYISKRTHVGDLLEREGQLGLVKTSWTMMELNAFFERFHAEHYTEALVIAERLQLLPVSQSEFAAKETEYNGLNTLVKQAYPAFVVATMDILYSEYYQIKRDLQAGASSVVRERLRELKEKANLLVTFAQHVPVPAENVEALSRLESLMI